MRFNLDPSEDPRKQLWRSEPEIWFSTKENITFFFPMLGTSSSTSSPAGNLIFYPSKKNFPARSSASKEAYRWFFLTRNIVKLRQKTYKKSPKNAIFDTKRRHSSLKRYKSTWQQNTVKLWEKTFNSIRNAILMFKTNQIVVKKARKWYFLEKVRVYKIVNHC